MSSGDTGNALKGADFRSLIERAYEVHMIEIGALKAEVARLRAASLASASCLAESRNDHGLIPEEKHSVKPILRSKDATGRSVVFAGTDSGFAQTAGSSTSDVVKEPRSLKADAVQESSGPSKSDGGPDSGTTSDAEKEPVCGGVPPSFRTTLRLRLSRKGQTSLKDVAQNWGSITEILQGKGWTKGDQQVHIRPNLCTRIVDSSLFDIAMAIIIAINIVIMAAEAEYNGMEMSDSLAGNSHTGDQSAEDAFEVFSWIFGVIFWIELLVRIVGKQHALLCDLWAWLDMLVVVSWTIAQVGVYMPVDPTMVRLARLLRLARLVKFIRTFQGFDALQVVLTAMHGSVTSLLWSTIILFMVATVLALFIHGILHETYFRNLVDAGEMDRPEARTVFKYFGTFSRSLYSMFELALANWPPIGRVLAEEVSEWFMFFSVLHKLIIGFALVGVINGIFMQETFKVVTMDDSIMVRQKQRQIRTHATKMKRLFKLADTSNDGSVSLEEFRDILKYGEVRVWLASMDFDTSDVETVFALLAGSDGRLTEQELIDGVAHLRGPARSIDLVSLMTSDRLGMLVQKAISECMPHVMPQMMTATSTGSRSRGVSNSKSFGLALSGYDGLDFGSRGADKVCSKSEPISAWRLPQSSWLHKNENSAWGLGVVAGVPMTESVSCNGAEEQRQEVDNSDPADHSLQEVTSTGAEDAGDVSASRLHALGLRRGHGVPQTLGL